MNNTKALCLFAIGNKYKRILEKNFSQFDAYAKKCNAELVIIKEPLDATMKRSVLSQKLLIPFQLKNYDTVVFIDLDVVISNTCPSLFDLLPHDKGFAAVCSPRETEKFKAHYKSNKRVLEETTETYFTDRNFALTSGLQGAINGGVLVFKPSKVASLFYDYYFSDHSQGEHEAYEEAPMAYISQSNKLFVPLDENYNRQFFYELYTPQGQEIYTIKSKLAYKIINKALQNLFYMPNDALLYNKLYKLRNFLIKNDGVHILHFSGKSLPKLYTEHLFLI